MIMQILNFQVIIGTMLMAIGAFNLIVGLQKAERAKWAIPPMVDFNGKSFRNKE